MYSIALIIFGSLLSDASVVRKIKEKKN